MLLKRKHASNSQLYHLVLGNMTSKQQQKIKSPIVNINNWLYEIFSAFNPLNNLLYLGYRLIDVFPSHISIHSTYYSSNKSKSTHCKKLNELVLKSSLNLRTVIIISDTSIKNNITSFISYIYSFINPLKRILHYTVNIMLMEAELFTIRYSIN